MPVTEQDVLSALKSCYDPEIPVNIVDLGLIYTIRFEPVPAGTNPIGTSNDKPEETKQDVAIDMTLTAQGCPELPGIRNVNVHVVWTPPWTPERLSPDAKKQLGID